MKRKSGPRRQPPKEIKNLIELAGGTVNEVSGPLSDGSGFVTASFSLPKDHWLYVDAYNDPPMPFKMGTDDPRRHDWETKIREAGKYAVRASTMNGKVDDFDPDAMVQNFIIGMIGYYTPDGESS